MATERIPTAAPQGYDYNDPKASLAYLLNPGQPLPETDERAAAAAVAGGFAGSPFAANNRLRLRDSERIDRMKIGQELLQPYLNRESAERMKQSEIAAQAASDALRESGAASRLSIEQQGALQRALINGDQQAAHDLLTEAGADRRQASQLATHLRETTMNNQNELLRTLLPYAYGGGSGGAGGGGATAKSKGGNFDRSAGFPGTGAQFYPGSFSAALPQDTYTPYPTGNPAAAGGASAGSGRVGGVGARLGPVLDRLLRSYGLG